MTKRIWRGDAPAVAQVSRITPGSVEIGDTFSVTINGKSVTVTATAATAASVVALLVSAIAASNLPEFREVVASADSGTLLLTAATAGRPFIATASAGNGSSLGVVVTTTTQGSAAVSAVNMTQVFAIPVSAAGTFNLWCGGASTSAIAVGASAATVQSAIEGLSVIGSGNVSVAKTSDSNDDTYVCTFQGTLAATQVALMTCVLTTSKPVVRTTRQGSSTGTLVNEIQTITFADGWTFDGATYGSTYTLTHDSQTTSAIDLRSTAATIQANLRALSTLEDNDVNVTASGNMLVIDFVLREGQTNQSQFVAGTISGGILMSITIPVASTAAVAASSAVNEIQVVTLTGSPTGGTFTITFDGQTTATIAYNASASTVLAALENLSNIDVGDVTVTGTGPWTVTFAGALAAANQPQMTGSGTGLTGGSGQSVSVSAVTGSSGPNHWDTAANWLPSGVPVNSDTVRFEFGSVDCLYGLDQSSVTLGDLHFGSAYTGSVGLPRLNSNGYVEYRVRDLTIHCPSILIGHSEGPGSGKIQLNTLNTVAALEIRNTGGSRESGVPAVTWYGDHASNSIKLLNGDLGVAIWSDQTAQINTVQQFGGTLRLNNSTINDLYCPGQAVTAHESTLGGQPLEL